MRVKDLKVTGKFRAGTKVGETAMLEKSENIDDHKKLETAENVFSPSISPRPLFC